MRIWWLTLPLVIHSDQIACTQLLCTVIGEIPLLVSNNRPQAYNMLVVIRWVSITPQSSALPRYFISAVEIVNNSMYVKILLLKLFEKHFYFFDISNGDGNWTITSRITTRARHFNVHYLILMCITWFYENVTRGWHKFDENVHYLGVTWCALPDPNDGGPFSRANFQGFGVRVLSFQGTWHVFTG